MIQKRPLTLMAFAGLIACALAGPAAAGDKTRNTVIGAGVGAAAGAVLSNGDPAATIGGAAVGGLIGNVTTKDHDRYDNRRYYRDRDRHYHRHHDRHRHHRGRGHDHH